MIILGIDTSSATASVAIADDNKILCHKETMRNLSHSESVMPMLQYCLDVSKKNFNEISLIGIVTGPGSFTGLRIGISTAMGISYSRNIPSVPLSSLEVTAFSTGTKEGEIRPVIYSYRDEYYTALFKVSQGTMIRMEEDRIEKYSQTTDKSSCISIKCDGSETIMQNMENLSTGSSAALLANKYRNNSICAKSLKPNYLHVPVYQEKVSWK